MYTFKQDGDRFVVSIDNHQELMGAIAAFCQEQGILAGEVSGIGAVNNATLRFLNPATKHYVDKTFDEQMEISSLVGNISEKDGKVYLHLHANFGRRTTRSWADTFSQRPSTERARCSSDATTARLADTSTRRRDFNLYTL